MTTKVTLIDFGVGNLYSVQRALEFCGAESIVVSSAKADIENASRLVLPGVGAFADGMRGLEQHGLVDAIREYASSGRPLLGICLGMQMLATSSEEFGLHAGLDLIPGRVVAIPREHKGVTRKIPYIGWAELSAPSEAAWRSSLMRRVEPGNAVYLVHSYHMVPDSPGHVLATYDFNGESIVAAVQKDNIVGLQFHPEKSSDVGLEIMASFVGTGG